MRKRFEMAYAQVTLKSEIELKKMARLKPAKAIVLPTAEVFTIS